MIKKLIVICLTWSCWNGIMGATFSKENITVRQLPNGLKVLLFEDHNIPNIAYYTFYKVGSRNERPGLTGVSHFIEHMMFNGSTKVPPGQFDKIMEFNGGSNNAYTSDDLTAYTDWFPAKALDKMMEMEADRMQGSTFDATVLESERGVVASERRLSVENDNEGLLMEQVRATAILAHPYHWDVIGWMSDIMSWKREEILGYYHQFYAPNNAVLVVVGDFATTEMVAAIEKHYAAIPAAAKPAPITTKEPEQMGPRRTVLYRETQTPSFIMAFPAPACTDADYPAMQVLDLVLLQGESCRLYQRLVAQEQLAIDIGGGAQETIDPFLFFINVKPKPDADVQRIEQIIDEELLKLQSSGVQQKEIEKAVNIIQTHFYSSQQSIAGKANNLGVAEVMYGDYAALFDRMSRYQTLTVEQITRTAAKYFDANKKTLGLVLPKGGSK
jgi:zinc protease